MKLTARQFEELSTFAFSSQNPGFKPAVIESPNGDGVWDAQKQYAHIALKYFDRCTPSHVRVAYLLALDEANRIIRRMGLPAGVVAGDDSTLRLLRYPPGATTAPHTDFDLFTLSLYRSHVGAFVYRQAYEPELLSKARQFSPGIHFGELMTEILGDFHAPATRHETVALDVPSFSAVFFVIPPHEYVLPSGLTVGEWLKERIARSRKAA
jgi:hypothetical protein